VDLTDNSLMVDISDALSEKDKVKFTVHTKVRWLSYSFIMSDLNMIKLKIMVFWGVTPSSLLHQVVC
jgi:sorting nexin-5/6/32